MCQNLYLGGLPSRLAQIKALNTRITIENITWIKGERGGSGRVWTPEQRSGVRDLPPPLDTLLPESTG